MRGFDTGFDPSAASVTDGHDVDALANSHLYIAGRADSDPSIPFPARDPGDPCGDDLVWINEDATTHTVTGGKPEAPSGLFDSGPLEQGRSFSWTFRQAGEYPYFCQRHTHMQGIIRVR